MKKYLFFLVFFIVSASIALNALEPIFIPVKIDGPVHDPDNDTFWYGPFNEGHSVLDVNGDGTLDITCGANWYEGPDWIKHEGFRDKDVVCEFPLDVNKDGRMDIVSGGWFENGICWYENPGKTGVKWKTTKIMTQKSTEGLVVKDIDNDGDQDILINHWANEPDQQLTWLELLDDKPEFRVHLLGNKGNTHGGGVGDINGDGRKDIVTSAGWYEAPQEPAEGEWIYHGEFQLPVYPEQEASLGIIVFDINGDGLNDFIYGNGHGYGLFWVEQQRGGKWTTHTIEDSFGQFHTLVLADVDQNGIPDLVTGKRLRGHDGHDKSSFDPLFVFWYEINGGEFKRHVLYYNHLPWYKNMELKKTPPNYAIGGGTNITVKDLNKDGLVDIVCSGKSGLYLFLNRGLPPTPRLE
ncbi:FG-GAP repeat domain-containing protein [Candidatus Latescibacterota bacterium]